MILEVRSLQLVLAIADYGTLTQAARYLHLTQSALSHQLLQLEARLRLPLFHRMGRRMVATQAGEKLVELARRVVPELVRTEEAMRSEATGKSAVIRLSTECYTCYHWLPSVLVAFRAHYPGVDVQIVPEATRRPVEALLESRLDLAIIHSETRHPRLRYFPLFIDEMVLVIPPEHSLASRTSISPSDLIDEHLITYALSPDTPSLTREFLAEEGVTPKRVSEIQLTEAIIEMVKAGLGVTILAQWAVQPAVDAGTVRTVRLGRSGLKRPWNAAVLQGSTPVHLRKFIQMIARGPDAIAEVAASA